MRLPIWLQHGLHSPGEVSNSVASSTSQAGMDNNKPNTNVNTCKRLKSLKSSESERQQNA